MRIILVRHGETNWNSEGRIMGLSDIELNKKGVKQAELLALSLKSEKIASIYTSPLRRARETAHKINYYHQVAITSLDGLREIDAGKIDGLTYIEIKRHYGDFFEKWMENCATVRPPGGCTVPEVQEQAWSAIQEILNREKPNLSVSDDRVVLVVSHFFPIRTILCKVLDIDLSECRRIRLDIASISIIDFHDDRMELVKMNDICHWKEDDR